MRIALLGGTGDIGAGLALRWGRDTDHTIVVGSRDSDRAVERTNEYEARIAEHDGFGELTGTDNATATAGADVVVVSVPPQHAVRAVEGVRDDFASGAVLVSPAVEMARDGSGFHYDPPQAGSVAEAIAAVTPADIPVVSAFQNLAAGALTDLDRSLALDVVVTGDDPDAKETVTSLAEEIDGLRALDAGGLANSAEVESVTPLLINLAMNNDGMHDLGVRFQ